MENKQLSYDALKSVLRHMEANKRIQISAACPSLRKIEKKVPLKIDHLYFRHNYEVRINDKLYTFGVIQNNRNGNTPKRIQSQNDGGGFHLDIDEWGFDRESYGLIRTPGDLIIGDVPETMEENYSDAEMQPLLKEIKKYRRDQINYPDEKYRYEERIAYAEAELAPYYRRQNNEKSPYDCFIQFSILAKNERYCSEPKPKTFVCVPYNKPMYHAMKFFMNFVFEGRSTVIQVKCLELGNRDQIIRLPEEIKFSIQQLKGLAQNIEEYSKGLTPVLEENCHYFLHGDLADVEKIYPNFNEVTFGYIRTDRHPFQNISEWPYLKMNYFNRNRKCQGDEIITLISNLLEMDKKVGTTFRFGFETAGDMIKVFDSIAKHFKIDIENKSITLSLNILKQLHISYQVNIEYMCYEATGPLCILTMEIMAHEETDS